MCKIKYDNDMIHMQAYNNWHYSTYIMYLQLATKMLIMITLWAKSDARHRSRSRFGSRLGHAQNVQWVQWEANDKWERHKEHKHTKGRKIKEKQRESTVDSYSRHKVRKRETLKQSTDMKIDDQVSNMYIEYTHAILRLLDDLRG